MASLASLEVDTSRHDRRSVAEFVAKENFLSRSIISASFSLAEAFISGLFFSAINAKSIGHLDCNEEFLKFAATKESAPLRDRLDCVVRFASNGKVSGTDEPFRTLIDVGKRYRDAIHHTTPFQRKDVEPGERLTALYEINGDIALRCVVLSTSAILQISRWINSESYQTDVASRCEKLIQDARPPGSAANGQTQMVN
jgi:hypothetical protein